MGGPGGIAAADDQKPAENDESGPRFAWKVTSIVIVVLTLLLNLILVGVIVVKRTSGNDLVNKAVLCIGMVDLIYAVFVSPFFIENYIDIHWFRASGIATSTSTSSPSTTYSCPSYSLPCPLT